MWAGWRSRYSDCLRVGRSRDRIPGRRIFRNCPDRPWGPPSLLYNGYRVFPEGKLRPGRDADPTPPSSTEVKNRVELYLYSPEGLLWPMKGWNLPTILSFARPTQAYLRKWDCIISQKLKQVCWAPRYLTWVKLKRNRMFLHLNPSHFLVTNTHAML
jgi:hypothetical protein